MHAKTAVAITSLLAIAEAIQITKPAKGDDWDLSKTNEITWSSVSSDPKSFEIVIVNQSGYPEVTETIAKVNTADGKYELKGATVAAGDGYRINFISTDPQNSGILAQSQEFSLTSDNSDDKTASATASASASASVSATDASTSGSASVTATASGLTTVTTGTAKATASETAASHASGTASGTATGSAASGTSTSAPSSANALKSTFAIFGSVAVAAYMLF